MKARRDASEMKPAIPLRRKRLVVEDRLVFVDIELAPVGRRRAILQIAAMAVSRSLVELESFEAKVVYREIADLSHTNPDDEENAEVMEWFLGGV